MKLIKSSFVCFTIWMLAALFNAMLTSICLYSFSADFTPRDGNFFLVFIFSLIFSVPGIIIFWIVLLVNWNEDMLFRTLLKTGFIVAAASSLFLCTPIFDGITKHPLSLAPCIIIATIGSIMLHHSLIISFFSKK